VGNAIKNEDVRQFVAIIPGQGTLDSIEEILGPCKSDIWSKNIRWQARDSIHLTLRFLGKTRKEQSDRLKSALSDLCRSMDNFALNLGFLTVLPGLTKARVVCVGIKQNHALEHLAKHIEQIAINCSFAPEKKPFKPHITLGRCRNLDLRKYEPKRDFQSISMHVTGVDLVRSTLYTHGAVYNSLSTFGFAR